MKLSITQENLAKALGVVGRVVSSRSSLPVLSNVLLSTDHNRLKLSSTNLEVGINYWIGGRVEQDGSITVPAKLFSEYVSSLPPGNIELTGRETNLVVKTPHYESQINGISAEEFPVIPELKAQPVLELAAADFREALAQVVVAASLDEARPVLAGVYFKVTGKQLVMVATDSYRLAEKKVKLKGGKTAELAVIVPARSIQELVRILAEVEEQVKMFVSENQVMFEVEGIQLTSRLIEGQFPNYQQIIPAESETDVTIKTSEFSNVVKVAGLFARENAGSIKINIRAEGSVSVTSSASQVGENTSNADCEVAGEDAEISLNSRYLMEALGAMKAAEVMFSVSGKLNPCVIRPVDQNPEEYLYIIMPLRT